MVLIILGLISIFLCYKWGDWRNWRTYYPTILFYIIADFNHALLTSKTDLWIIHGFWNDTLADYFISFIIAPGVVILFLSNFPERLVNKLLYILSYAAVLSAFELVALKLNWITYYNGWCFGWTAFLYLVSFTLLRLHHKHPWKAWTILIILTAFVVIHFKISLANI